MKYSYLFLLCLPAMVSYAQPEGHGYSVGIRGVADADSTYVGVFRLRNDARFIYGAQSSSLRYGSNRAGDAHFKGDFNNANDVVGVGLTYKIIDFDAVFSTGTAAILNAENRSLKQFRLGASYTARKVAVRAFYSDSKGMVVSGAGQAFSSSPDIHMLRMGVQATYIFHARRYSFRAAHFQNEIQRKTAGSFLLRLEPFYRTLGTDSRFVPQPFDDVARYGDQTGLRYLHAPGLIVMPGYAVTVVARGGAVFVSPFVVAGPGVAVNIYRSDAGRLTAVNIEMAASVGVNAGYTHERFYAKVRATYDVNYMPIQPAFFAVRDVNVSVVLGYRFGDIESVIPVSLGGSKK